jgi:hypothetical protein
MRSPSSPAALVAGRQMRCRNPGQPQRPTLRTREHQVSGGPRVAQLLGQGLDHDPGGADTPVASSGLGRPERHVAADLGEDLHDLDHPVLQVDAAAA